MPLLLRSAAARNTWCLIWVLSWRRYNSFTSNKNSHAAYMWPVKSSRFLSSPPLYIPFCPSVHMQKSSPPLAPQLFSHDPSCAAALSSLMSVLLTQTLQMLPTLEVRNCQLVSAAPPHCPPSMLLFFLPQSFTERPDMADDCFLMASRCVRYCPSLLLPLPIFPLLVDSACAGLIVQHR